VLLHYLGKVNSSNLLQITTGKKHQKASRIFAKMKRLCCHTGDRTQLYCFLQQMLEVSALCLHTCTKTRHSSIALSMMLWSTSRHTCCKRCFSLSAICSDVNKDLGLKAKAKAKDSDPKAKAKDPKYQGQIFHRSSPYSVHHFFIVNVV